MSTASELYSVIEADVLAAIDMAAFLARVLDAVPDLDAVNELPGAAHVVNAIRDRMQAVKDAMLEARGEK